MWAISWSTTAYALAHVHVSNFTHLLHILCLEELDFQIPWKKYAANIMLSNVTLPTSVEFNCYLSLTTVCYSSSPTVYNFLCTLPRSAAPHTPRVLLLGPTGSGKSLQAAQLARSYHLVNIDCKELIKRTIASGSKLAVQMKPFDERGLLSKLEPCS